MRTIGGEVVNQPVHPMLQAARGMCVDRRPYEEIDELLGRAVDVAKDLEEEALGLGMVVRFVLPQTKEPLDYDFGRHRVPAVGESIQADGLDPGWPAGIYEVASVTHHVSLDGPGLVVCGLAFVARLPVAGRD